MNGLIIQWLSYTQASAHSSKNWVIAFSSKPCAFISGFSSYAETDYFEEVTATTFKTYQNISKMVIGIGY